MRSTARAPGVKIAAVVVVSFAGVEVAAAAQQMTNECSLVWIPRLRYFYLHGPQTNDHPRR